MTDWLTQEDSQFLKILRAVAIFVIVFGHVGGGWIYPPWSQFLNVSVPIFFFISGAVSYNSYLKKNSVAHYLCKRIIGLIVPYYCICIFSIFIFLFQHAEFPNFDIHHLIQWITVGPSNRIMPFPLGQVWFLHVLIIINLFSPVFFYFYYKNRIIYILILCLSLFLSSIPIISNFVPEFIANKLVLFQPVVGFLPAIHMLFFCLGFYVFDNVKIITNKFSIMVILISISVSILFVRLLGMDINYANHGSPPDTYYVIIGVGSIFFFVLIRKNILLYYNASPKYFRSIVDFFFKHTFSIFLLHTFGIFFVEKVFGVVDPPEKTIFYGVTKFILVLLVTLSMAPVFTKLTNTISNKLSMHLMPRIISWNSKD